MMRGFSILDRWNLSASQPSLSRTTLRAAGEGELEPADERLAVVLAHDRHEHFGEERGDGARGVEIRIGTQRDKIVFERAEEEVGRSLGLPL